MPRTIFERELDEIKSNVAEMGRLVGESVLKSVDALKRQDLVAAKKVVDEDSAIDQMRFDIEDKCIQAMATQQPMAVDLRQLVAVLNIIVDLERMADHAEGIARVTLRIGKEPLLKPLIDIPRMAQLSNNMLKQALDAFIKRDVKLAEATYKMDDEVDDLYHQVFREVLTYMISDPKNIDKGTYLIWVAHDLERVADRSTNIAERVVFAVTGKMKENAGSKFA